MDFWNPVYGFDRVIKKRIISASDHVKLTAYKKYGDVYDRFSDHVKPEGLRFSLIEVLEAEDQGILFLEFCHDTVLWHGAYYNYKTRLQGSVTDLPPSRVWDDVRIILIDSEHVTINTSQGSENKDFREMDMMDLRTRKPKKLWRVLMHFCVCKGEITIDDMRQFQEFKNLKFVEYASDLNDHLKKMFDIDDSIFKTHFNHPPVITLPGQKPYRKPKGYYTKIQFSHKIDMDATYFMHFPAIDSDMER